MLLHHVKRGKMGQNGANRVKLPVWVGLPRRRSSTSHRTSVCVCVCVRVRSGSFACSALLSPRTERGAARVGSSKRASGVEPSNPCTTSTCTEGSTRQGTLKQDCHTMHRHRAPAPSNFSALAALLCSVLAALLAIALGRLSTRNAERRLGSKRQGGLALSSSACQTRSPRGKASCACSAWLFVACFLPSHRYLRCESLSRACELLEFVSLVASAASWLLVRFDCSGLCCLP